MPKRKDVLLEPAHSHSAVTSVVTAVLQSAQLQGANSLAPCSVCPRTSQRVLGRRYHLLGTLLVAQPKPGWPSAAPLLPLPVAAEISHFDELEDFLSRLFATCFVSFFPFPCHLLLYKIQTCIAKLLFQNKRYRYLFHVLMARCQRAGVAVSNSQKNKWSQMLDSYTHGEQQPAGNVWFPGGWHRAAPCPPLHQAKSGAALQSVSKRGWIPAEVPAHPSSIFRSTPRILQV